MFENGIKTGKILHDISVQGKHAPVYCQTSLVVVGDGQCSLFHLQVHQPWSAPAFLSHPCQFHCFFPSSDWRKWAQHFGRMKRCGGKMDGKGGCGAEVRGTTASSATVTKGNRRRMDQELGSKFAENSEWGKESFTSVSIHVPSSEWALWCIMNEDTQQHTEFPTSMVLQDLRQKKLK